MSFVKYELNSMYRIQTKNNNQLYTGFIVEQDETHIKVKTIKSEEVILLREDILKAKKWT